MLIRRPKTQNPLVTAKTVLRKTFHMSLPESKPRVMPLIAHSPKPSETAV